jgi:N-acetylmuramoyl-L-alanine amidase
MRTFEKIILHCTATEEGAHYDVATIRKWHVEGRGWRDIGYHYLIYLDGSIHAGRPIMEIGAHTKGQNSCSVGIAYVGGVDKKHEPKDTMTSEQEMAFLLLVRSLRTVFGNMTLHGHNEFANKACPSFKVRDKYKFLID